MSQVESAQTAGYELPLAESTQAEPPEGRQPNGGSLPETLLQRNLTWFCRLRWSVVVLLLVFGVLSLLPGLFQSLGLRPHEVWPFVTGGVLALFNLAFHAGLPARSGSSRAVGVNLGSQIALDLVVLTAVVHFSGSMETYVAFAYLFHIVLACIFFPPRRSLQVALLACLLFGACVAAETVGLLPSHSIYSDQALRRSIESVRGAPVMNLASAVAVWLVTWYLASHLSAMVQERDFQLGETNRRLVAAQQERTQHMLRTTHELKSPFAAIHANTQILLGGFCGELPKQAAEVVERIATRSRRLAREIQEMLQLANLQSGSGPQAAPETIDLSELLQTCIGQVQQIAQERGITIQTDSQPAATFGVRDHVKMLFTNLLSNAVLYSYEGGRVEVTCRPEADGRAGVTVQDHGIGIDPQKLPHIFEEYYHTEEAVRHNKESTGLGLAIVRHVAQTHGIRLRVESSPRAGTRFILSMPPAPEGGLANPDRQEA